MPDEPRRCMGPKDGSFLVHPLTRADCEALRDAIDSVLRWMAS